MYMDRISVVGTLGNDANDVTCSVLAAKSLSTSITIAPFSEFEFAAESLIEGIIDAMVVPGAYPYIAKFIMDEQLIVTNVYTFVIPSLVFVSKYAMPMSEYDILYNHPATNALLGDIRTSRWNVQKNVSSNTVACLEAIENEYACCAITNAACAEKYGILIHQVLREGINMPFVLFTKKGGR